MKIEVELTADDLAMVEAFEAWKRAHPTRSPKSHEIVWAYHDQDRRVREPGGKVFDRLKLLGVIDHKRNGHCWLSASFKARTELAA